VLLTIDAPPGARVLSLEWNDGDAWRVAIEPIILAAGNPGSRRWFIRDRGLSGGERWRLSRDHYLDSKSTFRNRDLGTLLKPE